MPGFGENIFTAAICPERCIIIYMCESVSVEGCADIEKNKLNQQHP
jgi:hypothetical protein